MPSSDTRTAFQPTVLSGNALRWDGHMADDVAATYGPEPLAALTASNEELLLSGTRGTFRLPRTAVRKIGRGRLYPWLFSAVRIHHDLPQLPRELQFKPLGTTPRDILAQLATLGYPTR